jgi:nucleotide-binding universal stress UspA family protein
MIKHILFPTDGSDNSNKALQYVKEIALKFGAKVTVVTVYESPLLSGIEIVPYTFSELEKSIREIAEDILEKTHKEVNEAGISCNTRLEQGDPGKVIVELLENNEYDLVIMGSRGLGTVKSFLLGSVSNYVLHHTNCPIMIVRGDE